MQHARYKSPHSRWSRLHPAILAGVLVAVAGIAPADTLNRLSDVFTYMPKPLYPIDAVWRSSTGWKRAEGRTVCRVTLNADGTVAGVQIAETSGHKLLDQASVQAFRQWHGKPGRAGRFYNIPVRFSGGESTPGSDNGMNKDGLGMTKGRDR